MADRMRLVVGAALTLALAGCGAGQASGDGTPSAVTTTEQSAPAEETAAEPAPTVESSEEDVAGPTLVPADEQYLAAFDRTPLASNPRFVLVHPDVDPADSTILGLPTLDWMLVDVPAGVAVEGYRLYSDATHSVHPADAWDPIPVDPSWPQSLILVDANTGELVVDLGQ